MILDSLDINYQIVDVTEPGHEKEREQMQTVCKKREPNNVALPPQFFNDDTYCGVSSERHMSRHLERCILLVP